ncbi:hypothetical protein BGX38DRAFT_1276682 [Terfezia claveryi]|nr:hypothetical protein BGX38DRAFT_1276682 [Terfezia claveryi]
MPVRTHKPHRHNHRRTHKHPDDNPMPQEVSDSSTQTIPPTAHPTKTTPLNTTNSVSTSTDPPPARTYAAAATSTTQKKPWETPFPSGARKGKGKEPAVAAPPSEYYGEGKG